MPIEQKIKDAVHARLLAELEMYFEHVEKTEDEVFQLETDVADRLDDFVVSLAIKLDHEIDGHAKVRHAKPEEIREALRAYRDGVLREPKYTGGVRPFVASDSKNIVMALALKNLDTNEAIVTEMAERMNLT